MAQRAGWTRQELPVAFSLYCRLPFGRLHRRNPEIVEIATALGRSPSALAMKLTNIASLDPAITSTGRSGLRAVSAADRALWKEMQSNWEEFAINAEQAVDSIMAGRQSAQGTQEVTNLQRVGEDRDVVTTARVGQSFFRNAVLSAYNGRCCITGLSSPTLLRAGHIVPWHVDKSNRVNPRNGLLLSILHERAFDVGLITINEDMTVRVSVNHDFENDDFYAASIMRYDGKLISLPEKFAPKKDFIAYHREHIFSG